MAIRQTAIVEGVVSRVSVVDIPKRDAQGKLTGEVFTFRDALIVGDHSLVEARVPDRLEMPKQGAKIRAVASIDVYRGDAQVSLVEYLG
jgi:hypothetical protein